MSRRADCTLPPPRRSDYAACPGLTVLEQPPRHKQARSKAGLNIRRENRLIRKQDQLAPLVPGFARAFLATGEVRLVAGRFRANPEDKP